MAPSISVNSVMKNLALIAIALVGLGFSYPAGRKNDHKLKRNNCEPAGGPCRRIHMSKLKQMLLSLVLCLLASCSLAAQFHFTPKTWDELTNAADVILIGKAISFESVISKTKFLDRQGNDAEFTTGLRFEFEISRPIKTNNSTKHQKVLSILTPPIDMEEGPFLLPGKTYLVFLKKADADQNYSISYKDALLIKDRTDIIGSPKNVFDVSGSYVTVYRTAGVISNENKINEFLQRSKTR